MTLPANKIDESNGKYTMLCLIETLNLLRIAKFRIRNLTEFHPKSEHL